MLGFYWLNSLSPLHALNWQSRRLVGILRLSRQPIREKNLCGSAIMGIYQKALVESVLQELNK